MGRWLVSFTVKKNKNKKGSICKSFELSRAPGEISFLNWKQVLEFCSFYTASVSSIPRGLVSQDLTDFWLTMGVRKCTFVTPENGDID